LFSPDERKDHHLKENPIGVFDSGIGGLTAMQELQKLLPNEHIIYLGDSHNMPYGEKTPREIAAYSLRNLEFLLKRKVKAVFVACGTATVNALPELEAHSPVPVVGVVAPAVAEAAALTKNGRIGVLATRASIRTGAFETALKGNNTGFTVASRACPVFAAMVERGIFDRNDARVRRAAEEYLPPLKAAGVDTVILGCTHYPLLSEVIREYVGPDIELVSSGAAAARYLASLIRELGLARDGEGKSEFFTTGDRDNFLRVARFMLGSDVSAQLSAIGPLV
jgi:glutamate racemase